MKEFGTKPFAQIVLIFGTVFAIVTQTSNAFQSALQSNKFHTKTETSLPFSSTDVSQSSKPAKTVKPTFDNFDYEEHWYPCVWEEDLELDVPTKVTVFDVDYVVAKTPNGDVVSMKDFCTHKGAALSEGRITANGYFQCAYHGWSFDGANGDCVEIPQLTRSTEHGKRSSATIPKQACATAVPAMIHQNMVWIFPGGGLEKALAAPSPPSVPDELFSTMKQSLIVRDMPIDFSILLSNICDPDHGLFAHQSVGFDMYTASLDCGFETFVSEETDDGRGWSLRTKIDARDKLLEFDRTMRASIDPKSQKNKNKGNIESPWATFQFHAPTFVRMNRVDKTTGAIKFVSLFYVCPVGVGRSRFMAASLSGIRLPRWVLHLGITNFLDQDTYLLATQQGTLLSREAEDLRKVMKEKAIGIDDTSKFKAIQIRSRTKSFVLPSPTDKISARLENFWDSTLARCPNRVINLLKLDESGAFLKTPPREYVLDRKVQGLDISRAARDVVHNCRRTKTVSKVLSLLLAIGKLVSNSVKMPSPPFHFLLKIPLISRTSLFFSTLACLSLASFLAEKLEKEYYFKYTDDYRRADLRKIPQKIWLDK